MINFETLQKNIMRKFEHSFLKEYIGSPSIDNHKLQLIAEMTAHLEEEKREQYINATMLVQIALDIHDTVERKTVTLEWEQAPKQTQLKVLAGDYYSGLYYYILAMANEIEFVQVLATAIKETNEAKLELYFSQKAHMDSFFKQFLKVDFLIFHKLQTYLEGHTFDEQLFDTYYSKRLYSELEMLEETNESEIYNRWITDKTVIPKQTFKKELQQFLMRFQ